MAVLVEGISVIIQAESVLSAFNDWAAFKAAVPNRTLCADGEIVRIGFMHPDDAGAFCDELERHGLHYQVDGEARDCTVCDQLRGFMLPTPWAEFGHIDWNGDPKKRVAACRRVGSALKQVVTPEGWTWENSLTASFCFVPNERAAQTMRPIGAENGLEVWQSPLSERVLFAGRAARRPRDENE